MMGSTHHCLGGACLGPPLAGPLTRHHVTLRALSPRGLPARQTSPRAGTGRLVQVRISIQSSLGYQAKLYLFGILVHFHFSVVKAIGGVNFNNKLTTSFYLFGNLFILKSPDAMV